MTTNENNRQGNLRFYDAVKQIKFYRKEIEEIKARKVCRAVDLKTIDFFNKEIEEIKGKISLDYIFSPETMSNIKQVYGEKSEEIKVTDPDLWYFENKGILEAIILYPNGCREKALTKIDDFGNTMYQKFVKLENQIIFPTK